MAEPAPIAGEPEGERRPRGSRGQGSKSALAPPLVFDLSASEIDELGKEIVASAGQPAYRWRQIRKWIYERAPLTFADMSDLPRSLRGVLEERLVLHPLEAADRQESSDGTRKLLWSRRFGAGDIESVLIPDRDRVTYCVSTQAGCPVKCPFCATGHGGFQGQLRAAEIVDQVVQMRALTGLAPTNIVYMGMGEPLLNFEPVCRSLEILTHEDQIGMGARRITVSTVGIPDRIRELWRRFPQVKLAISLHAARDELRDVLVPLNRQYPLREVLAAAVETYGAAGRVITLEYVLLPGVNDSEADRDAIVRVLEGIPSRVNLIGFNPFAGAGYEKPSVRSMVRFQKELSARFPGAVTLRRARGDDIQGACGQLSLRRA